MNSKSTKRALVSSALAMLVCVALLIGTTFAWFTDTASTSVSKIQSGNLDVTLEYAAGKTDGGETIWDSAEGKVLQFLVNGQMPPQKDDGTYAPILWEPGCTYELPALRVTNGGNLALKYKVQITGIKGDAMLNTVIDWTIGDVALGTEQHLAAGAANEFVIKGHMQETAGNDYMNKSIDGISVTVVATQDTVENDSYGHEYDKDAAYPVFANSQEDVNKAITDAAGKKVAISLPSQKTIALDNGIANESSKSRDITFVGNGTQTVDVITNAVSAEGGELNYQRGSSFTFENLTIQAGTGNFDGVVCDRLVYKNCTIKGKLTLYGEAEFINCTFDNTMENQYSIWTWGGTDVKFDGCTFNTNGKAILLYGRATESNPTNLAVNNCEFNDRNNGAAGKAAIEIGNDYNATYTLTVNRATVNGFADGKNTGSKLWANKNSMDAAHLSVTVDGTKVL